VLAAAIAVGLGGSYVLVRKLASGADITAALVQHKQAYTLALDHMGDMTLRSFAYLRVPLLLAVAAFLIGAVGIALLRERSRYFAIAAMMVVFFHAARLAMVTFDPFLSSEPIAEALTQSPNGTLIADHHYYWFSSVFFYADRDALLLNGPGMNLEYGTFAPGAPAVSIGDDQFRRLWLDSPRCYIVVRDSGVPHLRDLVGADDLLGVFHSGGKALFTNHPLPVPVGTSRKAATPERIRPA
jgi:hypothetical protein